MSLRPDAAESRSAVRDLAAAQALLVRLVTDAELRARWYASPAQVCDSLAIEPGARALMVDLACSSLNHAASSLLGKRVDEFRSVTRLTTLLCPELPARYRAWLAARPSPPCDDALDPGERNALRALPDLARALAEDERVPPFAADVLCFETLAAASRRDGGARRLRTRFDLPGVIAELRRGLIPLDPARATIELEFCGATYRVRQIAVAT